MSDHEFTKRYFSLIVILFCIITGYGFCTMPQDNQADCPNNDLTPPCPPGICCINGLGGAEGDPLGGVPNLPVMGTGFKPSIQSPTSMHTGSEAYSRSATSGPGASAVIGGIISTKKIVAQTEKILDFGGKGSIPLVVNLYYASYRPTFTDNKNGNTPLGPGWVLNYNMRLEDAIGSDNLLFRTATGHQITLIKTDTDVWKSRWFWTPLTVVVIKHQNDPEYGTLYKMFYDDDATEFGFHQYGRILYQKDPNGNMLKFIYDSTGKKLIRIDFDHTTNDNDDRYVTFSYTQISNLTRLTQITASDNRTWAFEYDTNAKVRLIRIKYRKNGSSSWNTLREYVYRSDNDYCITEMKATRGDGTFGTMISYEYYQDIYDVKKMKDLDGNTLATLSYSGNYFAMLDFPSGATIKVTSSPFRHPALIDYYINSQKVASHLICYRWFELMIDSMIVERTEDAAGNTTYFDYYGDIEDEFDLGNTLLKKVTYPDSSYVTYTYDVNGNITKMRDNMGKFTNYTYSYNNLASVTNPLNQTISYTYNTFGLLATETLPTNRTTTYGYDNYGRIKAITDADNLVTKYQYDTYGNLSCITDTNNRATKYQDYNDFFQVGKILDSESHETIITYNSAGLKSSVRDPKGNYTYFYYDKNYRLINVRDAMNHYITYTYDVRGNLTKFTDARSKETNYAYDEFNRLYTETDPLNNRITYTYSAGGCSSCGDLGALASKTDAKGSLIEYEYDNRGRLDKILYPNDEFVTFTYDYNGNRLAMYDPRLNIENETFSWEYDDINRVTKETYPNTDYITYTYNTFGARSQMRLPNGSTQTYSYDSRQRLSTIAHSLGNKTFTYSYNSDNTLKSIGYPNTMANRFTYDTLYRLINVSAVMYEEPEEMYYSIAYQYDANGNRTRAAWDSDEGINTFLYTKNYNYDALNQLTSEKKMNQAETSRLYEYQYEFDNAGNRTKMKYYDGSITTTTNYHYNDANQMWLRCKTYDYYYTYDENGNLTQEDIEGDPLRQFTWNDDNRMTYVDNLEDSEGAGYTYDAMGRRIMRMDSSTNTYTMYYYDGLTVIAEKEQIGLGSWNWKRIFTNGPGVIGNIFRISTWNGSSWVDTYYHYDAIGNVAMTSNSSGGLVSAIDQEAYGNVKTGSQSGYHLTTKEYDSIGELYYFWQRWYDPMLGEFLSRSPLPIFIEDPYTFSYSNPMRYIDLLGLYPQTSYGACWAACMLDRRNTPRICAAGAFFGLAGAATGPPIYLGGLGELGEAIIGGGEVGGAQFGILMTWGYMAWDDILSCNAECRHLLRPSNIPDWVVGPW